MIEEIKSVVHQSWMPCLGRALESSMFKAIVNDVLTKAPFCPSDPRQILRVLSIPIDHIKVVIIGQDPYPNPEHACGLAFAVPNDVKTPYSLRNICDEIALSVAHDLTLGLMEDNPFDTTLNSWVEQGVFLLNRALTCEVGASNSHKDYWSGFTELIIDCLAKQSNGLVWMLWGGDAKKALPIIEKYENNNVMTHTHPAAVMYGHPFIGCNHFKMANEILADQNKPIIKWV